MTTSKSQPRDHAPPEVHARTPARPRPISLALQGGGAHGAFTWGVLDALLEDGRLSMDAISATSAGAMNAVVMADGFVAGGPAKAREKLEQFWRAVAEASSAMNPLRAFPWNGWMAPGGPSMMGVFGQRMLQSMAQVWSPYQLNPLNINPLRDIIARVVDFPRLAASADAPKLFVSATNVRSGKIKVFENAALTADVVMASACLPTVFQTVIVDGEPYWDGGYMGNPAIFPLIYARCPRDVLIVHVTPIERDAIPRSASEILDRMNEISFNSSLMREMRAVAFVTRLIDDGVLDAASYARLRIHAIRNDAHMASLDHGSKLDPSWSFLCELRDAGRASVAAWLAREGADVGVRSTVDLGREFL